MPEARIDGVYVEKMCPRGREVILGMTRDPQFGPMLMFGLGGIFVEVMKDVTFHLAPITAEEALQMLAQHAVLRAAQGRARRGRRRHRRHRRRPAAHQPAGDRLPADRGDGHQPAHRRRGRHRAGGRRRPHHLCANERSRLMNSIQATLRSQLAGRSTSDMIATPDAAVARHPARQPRLHRHRLRPAAGAGQGAGRARPRSWPTPRSSTC